MARRLTVIAQDFRGGEATGIARYSTNFIEGLRKRGIDFELRVLSSREFRLGPIGFGFYVRIAYQRLATRPRGPVHSLHPIVIPPKTSVMTVWDLMSYRSPPSPYAAWRWIVKGVTRDLSERPRVYVAITNAVRDDLHQILGVPLERIRVAVPGVDTERFRPGLGPRPPALHGTRKIKVLHVGMGYERKGIHLLVEALGRLGPGRFRLVRVGPAKDPAYVASYLRRAEQLGLEVVECGFVPDDALPMYYANADLLVFPSKDEGAGIPPLEAMASGTNVVVSDLRAHREMCGDLAFYAGPGPESLDSAIEEVLAHPRDAGVLRSHSEAFSWAKTVDVYLRLYAELGIL